MNITMSPQQPMLSVTKAIPFQSGIFADVWRVTQERYYQVKKVCRTALINPALICLEQFGVRSLYWNNVTYPFPLTTNTNVLDIGDKTPMPLPLKLYITPVGAAGGVVIKAGEVIARIHMYKIATLGSGNPRNFTWNIISNNNVVMPTGGCTVDSRNVTVDLPDFPGSAEIPLGVYCSSEQKLSFYLSGATTDSSRQVFANTAPDATKASGVGVTLMRNGKILATGENVSLGTVNKSKVPLGLSATYGQTGNKVSAGTVQSVIGVTFIYE